MASRKEMGGVSSGSLLFKEQALVRQGEKALWCVYPCAILTKDNPFRGQRTVSARGKDV